MPSPISVAKTPATRDNDHPRFARSSVRELARNVKCWALRRRDRKARHVKRVMLVGVAVLIGALVFGLGSTAGAANYPPKAKTEVAVEGQSASAQTGPSSAAVQGRSPSTQSGPSTAAQGAPLPFTGGHSAELVWAGAALLVAGAALAGHRRRLVR